MENENNIKGVGLRALFRAYTESDASPKEQTSSKIDEVFRNIWERLDKKEKDITNGDKKQSSKKKRKGMQGIQMTQTPTLEKTENVQSRDNSFKDKEIAE